MNDQIAVAHLNSCLDLKKWGEIPYNVRLRIAKLLSHRRIGAVCFMEALGFGLRVFKEPDVDFVSDECETKSGQEVILDLEGHWLRCPADLIEQRGEEKFVKNNLGTHFLRWHTHRERWEWTASASQAKRFQPGAAEVKAKEFNGIIVPAYERAPVISGCAAGNLGTDPEDEEDDETEEKDA